MGVSRVVGLRSGTVAVVAALATAVACAPGGSLGAGNASSASSSSAVVARGTPQRIPAALVSADGLRITTTGRGGGAVASISLTARESATTVVLSLTAVPNRCPCTANLILLPEQVTLTTPLGDRRLIDHATGGAVPAMSGGELARVGWLPAGFALTPVDTLAPTEDGTPIGWARSYVEDSHPDSHVDVVQWRSTSVPYLPPSNATPTEVNGITAWTWHDGGADQGYAMPVIGRSVEWQQNGYTLVVSDTVDRVPSSAAVLNEDGLLRVARSLVLP